MKTLFILLFTLSLFTSCNQTPNEVEVILEAAGPNRAELEKVIEHYRKKGNEEKLRAVHFLIGNMGDKFWFGGREVEEYDTIFNALQHMYQNKRHIRYITKNLWPFWDSLVVANGAPSRGKADVLPDYENITADFLINHIDSAFIARNEAPWGNKLSFDQFCEFILPYRVGHEPPELWRTYLYQKFKNIRDTTNAKTSIELATSLNKYLDTYYRLNRVFQKYPFDIPVSKMEKGRMGACRHHVHYTAMAMRANGIPVGVDHTPLWANNKQGHTWNTLLQEDGNIYPFDAVTMPFGINMEDRKIAKVFRTTYAAHTPEFSFGNKDIPPFFYNPHNVDVTHEYIKTYDISIPLKNLPDEEKEYAIICTFNNADWAPQFWGEINDGKAHFKNMGSDVAYIVMYYTNGRLDPASDPFILKPNGDIQHLTPSEKSIETVSLYRKYPLKQTMYRVMESLKGGVFYGANKKTRSDSVALFTISQTPIKFETTTINNPNPFKYVWYSSTLEGKGNIAEIEFYGTKGQDTIKLDGKVFGYPNLSKDMGDTFHNAFDNDLNSYFKGLTNQPAWTGLQLNRPQQIVKIKFAPRSDTNYIEIGDEYELCYWKNGSWVSMGRKIATDQHLAYSNTPKNALLVLHNLTKGKEERIFTYENGQQVFW